MATTAVDGLVSGLSTSALIDQLMQVEGATQTKLKSRQTSTQKEADALTSINTKLAALKTAAENLRKPDGLFKLKTASTSADVAASAGAGAMSQSLTFDVEETAKAKMSIATFNTLDSAVGTAVMINGKSLSNGSGKLSETVAAINERSEELGVRAAAVKAEDGKYRLQLTSAKSGSAGAFTADGISGLTELVPASDAKIRIGGANGTGGYAVTSSSNTFSDVMPGVTFTVSKKTAGVTIDVTKDDTATSDAVKAFVDAANAVLDEAKAKSAYNADTKTGQPLSGDSTVRALTQAVASAISSNGGGSLKDVGIQLSRDGKFTFSAADFKKTLADNPDRVAKALVTDGGFTDALQKVAVKFGDRFEGQVTKAIESRKGLVKSFGDQITAWDDRLATRRVALQKQYSGLEVALGKLQSQSTWLAGQLSGLA